MSHPTNRVAFVKQKLRKESKKSYRNASIQSSNQCSAYLFSAPNQKLRPPSDTGTAYDSTSPMAIEADTKLRAANDLRKLLLDVESTTSFVLDANSESTEAYELWDCLDALLEDCDTHEDAAALLTALLDSGAVDALVGLMLDFPSLACSEPPVLWTASSEVSRSKSPSSFSSH